MIAYNLVRIPKLLAVSACLAYRQRPNATSSATQQGHDAKFTTQKKYKVRPRLQVFQQPARRLWAASLPELCQATILASGDLARVMSGWMFFMISFLQFDI